jgi:FkbM family methyltransferase
MLGVGRANSAGLALIRSSTGRVQLVAMRRELMSRLLMLAGGYPPMSDPYRGRVLFGAGRGLRLRFNLLDHPALLLGTYEPHVVRAMREHIRQGAVVYDVGANVGYLSLLAARFARPGLVVAFEPDPTNRQMLEANLRDNGALSQVDPRAVGCCTGVVKFATYRYSLVNHEVTTARPAADDAHVLTLESVSLDAFVYDEGNEPPSFIKIDVEGGELNVIAGAERLLREVRPTFVVEVREDTWPAIRERMGAADYSWELLSGEPTGLADILLQPAENASSIRRAVGPR